MIDFRKKYDEGYEAYKRKDFVRAREIYECLLQYNWNYFAVLRMLVNIDISQNNFREAREIIEKYMYSSNINTLRLLSRIESRECNYETNIDICHNVVNMSNDKYFVSNYYNLALAYILNGKFMEAKDILRNIPVSERNFLSDIYYITMDIVYENYENALERLNKVDKRYLPKTFYVLYDKANSLINYCLGKDKNSIEVLSNKGVFFRNILYTSEKENLDLILARHVWYVKEKEQFSDLKFVYNIDFERLYEEVEYKISLLNPQHYNFMSSYFIILDEVVGYNKDKPLFGLHVNTPMGINKIVKFSLFDFSDEFDREGKSTDKDLRKRLLVK